MFDEVEKEFVSLPEFVGSRQGLAFSGNEACQACDFDGEGFEGRFGIGRSTRRARSTGLVEGKDRDLIAVDDGTGRGVGLGARETLNGQDAACGDGVEGQALPQIVGRIESLCGNY